MILIPLKEEGHPKIKLTRKGFDIIEENELYSEYLKQKEKRKFEEEEDRRQTKIIKKLNVTLKRYQIVKILAGLIGSIFGFISGIVTQHLFDVWDVIIRLFTEK